MVTVDLVTGFLGAGKTTFIREYVKYLKRQGLRVRVIENEFGETSVDAGLLSDDCDVEDLTGMCMCCVGKSAFIRMLKESAHAGCDRIVVEPSGIYDADEFFEVLSLPEIAECCEIGTILTVADVNGIGNLSDEARYLLFSQLIASGMVVISKIPLFTASDEPDAYENKIRESLAKTENAVNELHALMRSYGTEGGLFCDVIAKPLSELTDRDFEDITDAGYLRIVHDQEYFNHAEIFADESYIVHTDGPETLTRKLKMLFNSPACGRIYRIKGYVKTDSNELLMVSCTPDTMSINYCSPEVALRMKDDAMISVIGQEIRRREIRELLKK